MKKREKRIDYPVKTIAENTYMISDFGIANCYLLVGDEKALLIDCGVGIGDIAGVVKRITDKPVIVAGTHGHVDHIGGAAAFPEIYLHPLDCGKHYRFNTNFFVRLCLLAGSRGVVDKSIKTRDLIKFKNKPEIIEMENGRVFDLGGRRVEVIHSTGHTKGSVLFKDEKTKILFVGDNMCPSPWLFLANADYVDEWLKSAKEIYALTEEYEPWWSHEGGLLSRKLISDVIRIGEEVVNVKFKRNLPLPFIKFYPKNDRVNGSIVFRVAHVHNKRNRKS